MRERNAFLELKKVIKRPIYINPDVPDAVRKAEFQMRQKLRNLEPSEKVLNINWRKYEIETILALYRLEVDGSFSKTNKTSNSDEQMDNENTVNSA